MALKFARDARQVAVHRLARGVGVVRRQRRDDRGVVIERACAILPSRARVATSRMEALLEAREDLAVALVP